MTAPDDRARDEQPAEAWEPGDPIHSRPRVDLEVGACEVIDNAFGALDDAARARVLRWAADRYDAQPAPAGDDELREAGAWLRRAGAGGYSTLQDTAEHLPVIMREYDERGRELERLRARVRELEAGREVEQHALRAAALQIDELREENHDLRAELTFTAAAWRRANEARPVTAEVFDQRGAELDLQRAELKRLRAERDTWQSSAREWESYAGRRDEEAAAVLRAVRRHPNYTDRLRATGHQRLAAALDALARAHDEDGGRER